MIPAPKGRHSVALCLFAAAAAVAAVQAGLDRFPTGDQINQAVAVVQNAEPGTYAKDPVFGDGRLRQLHSPAWQGYLGLAYEAAGRSDPLIGSRILAGPLVMLYLVGMYGLLWGQTRSWSISCFMAILSTAVIQLPGGSFWGIGPLSSLGPDGVCLAAIPLLAWAFRRWSDSPRVLWVFLAAGLLANVHLVSGANLALVLALTLLGRGRFRPRACLLTLLGLLCAAGSASPLLWHLASVRMPGQSPAVFEHWADVQQVFLNGRMTVLYPDMLERFLELIPQTLVLWTPAVIIAARARSLHVRNMRLWLSLLLATGFVGFLLHGICQAAGMLQHYSPPPIVDFVHALRLGLLPLYVLFAQAIVHLLRLRITWVNWTVRVGLVILLASWLGPTANTRVIRHQLENRINLWLPEEDRLERVREREDALEADNELRAICHWIDRNSPEQAVVASIEPQVRLWSRRALVASSADLKYFYYVAPHYLPTWNATIEAQRTALSQANEAELLNFAAFYGADYIVLRTRQMPEDAAGPAWMLDGRWGKHWVLFHAAGQAARQPASRPD